MAVNVQIKITGSAPRFEDIEIAHTICFPDCCFMLLLNIHDKNEERRYMQSTEPAET